MNYTFSPDLWVILPQQGKEDDPALWHRLFATWAGGYLSSDNWRLNSGIDDVTEDEDYFYVRGKHSDTIYRLHKNGQGVAGSSNSYALAASIGKAGIKKPVEDGAAFLRSMIRANGGKSDGG